MLQIYRTMLKSTGSLCLATTVGISISQYITAVGSQQTQKTQDLRELQVFATSEPPPNNQTKTYLVLYHLDVGEGRPPRCFLHETPTQS